MHIELSHDEAELVRDVLRQRVLDLDKEINRTDSLSFKEGLHQLARKTERILGEFSTVLEGAPQVEQPTGGR